MSYKKNCNRCSQQILMDESMGKWRALNNDGTVHICKEQQQSQNYTPQQQKEFVDMYRPQQNKQQTSSTLSLESLDIRLKILEAKISEVFGST